MSSSGATDMGTGSLSTSWPTGTTTEVLLPNRHREGGAAQAAPARDLPHAGPADVQRPGAEQVAQPDPDFAAADAGEDDVADGGVGEAGRGPVEHLAGGLHRRRRPGLHPSRTARGGRRLLRREGDRGPYRQRRRGDEEAAAPRAPRSGIIRFGPPGETATRGTGGTGGAVTRQTLRRASGYARQVDRVPEQRSRSRRRALPLRRCRSSSPVCRPGRPGVSAITRRRSQRRVSRDMASASATARSTVANGQHEP